MMGLFFDLMFNNIVFLVDFEYSLRTLFKN
jgi:hypothetical protein